LQIALDGVRAARLRLVGVAANFAERAATAQEIPATIEFDFDRAQPLLIRFEQIRASAVQWFAPTKLVLLGDKAFDP
jgi:hypothetical protein